MSTQNSINVMNHIQRRKQELISVFNSECCLCHFNAFPQALEFHHVHPEEKEFGITDSGNVTKSLVKQLAEMRKCVLVCANCHRGIHAGILQVPENYQQLFNEKRAEELLQANEARKQHKEYFCQRCGTIISQRATFCSDCVKIASRIVERPSREELKQLIRSLPFTTIAKQFYVSDNCIRKWCQRYNLPAKKLEINQYNDTEWEKI